MNDPNNRTNVPLGLDFNDFLPGGGGKDAPSGGPGKPNVRREKVPESKDPPIIEDVLKSAPNFRLLINTRKKNLTEVSNIWDNAKNKVETFEYLNDCKDLGIINDVVNFGFNKTPLKYMDMRSKEIVVIFPSIVNMCKSKYDMYFKNGILAAWKVLTYLEGVIVNAKQKQILNCGNIDIALEDKIRVYDTIIDYFHEIVELDNIHKHFEGKQIEGLDLSKFVSELTYFLKKCRGA